MDKAYNPQAVEASIYAMWESGGYFTPKVTAKKKPYSILLPLPNANDPMHMGHAMFVVQDILIRYHRMKGDPTLWLPGGDHAGIETQYVFEKKLAKEGKSRFDFDRETLYTMISDFVETNKNVNRDQMKRLGFSLDWTRYHYSLEPEILKTVFDTFFKLHTDGLLYRDDRLVNYCTKCGTSYSELEVRYVEQSDPLYFMRYGPFVLATVRPETKFGDTAVAVNPKDKRYASWVGKTIAVEGLLGTFSVSVIADEAIDPKFGTGVAKVTPAHDFTDFEIAKRHNLPSKQIIGFDGRLTKETGPYAGMKVKAAREKVAVDLLSRGLLDHVDQSYIHSVATCYKCGTVIEPLPLPQWYVKTKPLAEKAIKAVKDGKTKIKPLKRFEKMYFDWMGSIRDWNISRQIVWGPRIPAWYKVDGNESRIWVSFLDKNKTLRQGTIDQFVQQHIPLEEIVTGIQRVMVPTFHGKAAGPEIHIGNSPPPEGQWIQDTDTFDTWFLSSQWPLTTLGFPNGKDFAYFYPTSVLDTMWDILFFWVARMMMMGLYRTGKVPFETIHLHSRVVDAKGQKMSKSKGNVMDPIELVTKYSADALRFTLVFGAAPGSDIAVSDDKIRGMRNFANKIWNAARFVLTFSSNQPAPQTKNTKEDTACIKKLQSVVTNVTSSIEKFRFNTAAELLYESFWHWYCDEIIEKAKVGSISKETLYMGLITYIKLLHPFMPFVTEEIWSKLPHKEKGPLITAPWPEARLLK